MWMSEKEEPPVTGRSMSRPARQDALSQSLVAYMLANIRVFPHSFQSKLLHRNKIVVRLKIPGNRLQALQYHASTAINLIANSSQIPPQGSQTLRLRLGLGPSDLRQTFFAQGRARSADRPAAPSVTCVDAAENHPCDVPGASEGQGPRRTTPAGPWSPSRGRAQSWSCSPARWGA